ncbi:hypothetical protein CASFOL_041204 [Castilleja foliolosa]|uniref:Uncharacterized protein n=1 Tax=Castilleja foliolosa TaxID=1961234 RepID=A0ABD3BEA2_9LAMI
MEGRRRMLHRASDDLGEMKKGPWKAEEDQVLVNHVRKYGPRDWSSIRSKGLLRRTGKSCRLRWVNKLRPDLKTGVKFSAEEERTVIDLQAQFGNKWARIATYLTGRTDNDVKNFWSSRQKRLARMLHTSSSSSSSTPKIHKNTNDLETIAFLDDESLAKSQSCSSPHIDNPENIKLVPFMYPSSLAFQPETKPIIIPEQQQQSHISFQQVQHDFPLPMDSQDDIITSLGDPNFLDEFEKSVKLPIMPSIFEPDGSCRIDGRMEGHDAVDFDGLIEKSAELPNVSSIFEPNRSCRNNERIEICDEVDFDGLIDDFPPMDIFDHIPSPSEWP